MSDLHDIVIPDPICLSAASQEAKAEAVGLGKATNSLSRVLVLALMAGMQIGMGALFMTVVKSDAALSFGAAEGQVEGRADSIHRDVLQQHGCHGV